MITVLDKIVDFKQQELEHRKRKVTFKDIQLMAADSPPSLNFTQNFKSNEINIIAEIKKASPSKGVIRKDFDPIEIATIYQNHGAKALSILTDEKFFQGSIENLKKVKSKINIPCLRKDFTTDEYHIHEAKAYHADAILLIVAILDEIQLKDFFDLASELKLKVLIEIHNLKELKRLKKIKPEIVGVNNRNLRNFKTNLDISRDLIDEIKSIPFKISESGLHHHRDLVELNQLGFDGFLVGESLMAEEDIGSKLIQLIKG